MTTQTAPLVAGLEPEAWVVPLITGSDYLYEWTLLDEDGNEQDWPPGTHLYIDFTNDAGTSWEATVTGATATWNVDKATAASIDNLTEAKLRYVNGTTDLVYFIGSAVRYG